MTRWPSDLLCTWDLDLDLSLKMSEPSTPTGGATAAAAAAAAATAAAATSRRRCRLQRYLSEGPHPSCHNGYYSHPGPTARRPYLQHQLSVGCVPDTRTRRPSKITVLR